MAIDLTGINNVNEFYTDHYLASILENDLKDLFKAWTAAEKEQEVTPPDRKIVALNREYFRTQAALKRVSDPKTIMESQRPFLAGLLDALGYSFAVTEQPLDGNDAILPVIAGVTRDSGAPDLWIMETICPVVEMEDPLDLHLHPCQYQDEALAIMPEHDNLDELITKRVFTRTEPPRWIILLNLSTAILLDRSKWNEKRFLRFDLHEILSRREPSTLKALAALLHRDSICPGDGIPLLDTLGENSHKHAYSVSEDLKYAVREAVELLGNEAVWYLRERRRRGVFGSTESAEEIDPDALTRECLRYLYRLLFLFYIEARPELGYAPLNSEEYRLGYSLESLRELEIVPLTTQEAREGFYTHESLQLLFNLIFNGFEPSKADQALGIGGSAHHTFDMAPLKSHLFDPARTPILNRCRFRNQVLQRVIHLLSLSSGRGQKGGRGRTQRRGRISYAQLGINQLGAVYEGLLSYNGFFVTEAGGLYEVKKAGEEYDELQNAYFVPASELENYSDDEKFIPQSDPDHPGKTVKRLKHYPRGHLIYRLAGRNRQKSASYYTPEVLTQCVVKYALKELLKDKSADEILQLTICEPAMGSGAFLNEAINQLAEAYLRARMKDEGGRMNLGHEAYARELQKVKAYIAANNVYGVDLNPVAVELAEVSLWLNTMHPGCPVPWFNIQRHEEVAYGVLQALRAASHRHPGASQRRHRPSLAGTYPRPPKAPCRNSRHLAPLGPTIPLFFFVFTFTLHPCSFILAPSSFYRRPIMTTIQIELPDEVLLSLKETPEGLSKVIRMAAAAKLYELGKLSSGRAADLAGLPRVSFLQALDQYGVAIFDLTEEELRQDLRHA
jgi:predicted HTH domain antitoxin